VCVARVAAWLGCTTRDRAAAAVSAGEFAFLARPLSSGWRRRRAVIHRLSPLLRDPSACAHATQPVDLMAASEADLPSHGYQSRTGQGKADPILPNSSRDSCGGPDDANRRDESTCSGRASEHRSVAIATRPRQAEFHHPVPYSTKRVCRPLHKSVTCDSRANYSLSRGAYRMRNLYQVLGTASKVDDSQLKFAFRNLAPQPILMPSHLPRTSHEERPVKGSP
jgi:hypothetical protein